MIRKILFTTMLLACTGVASGIQIDGIFDNEKARMLNEKLARNPLISYCDEKDDDQKTLESWSNSIRPVLQQFMQENHRTPVNLVARKKIYLMNSSEKNRLEACCEQRARDACGAINAFNFSSVQVAVIKNPEYIEINSAGPGDRSNCKIILFMTGGAN